MTRGTLNHLAITVSDLAVAQERFYAPFLDHMGYEVAEAHDDFCVWWQPESGQAVNLWQAKHEAAHERYAPGFHHAGFNARDRADVDALHATLSEAGVEILDAPAEYNDYAPGYYAAFFADPDGLKFEYVHMPVIPD